MSSLLCYQKEKKLFFEALIPLLTQHRTHSHSRWSLFHQDPLFLRKAPKSPKNSSNTFREFSIPTDRLPPATSPLRNAEKSGFAISRNSCGHSSRANHSNLRNLSSEWSKSQLASIPFGECSLSGNQRTCNVAMRFTCTYEIPEPLNSDMHIACLLLTCRRHLLYSRLYWEFT